jgi:hypothetical protein
MGRDKRTAGFVRRARLHVLKRGLELGREGGELQGQGDGCKMLGGGGCAGGRIGH